MNHEKSRNIINMSEARKRQKKAQGQGRQGARFERGGFQGKNSKLSTLLRWIQFILLLGISTYVLQKCGMV